MLSENLIVVRGSSEFKLFIIFVLSREKWPKIHFSLSLVHLRLNHLFCQCQKASKYYSNKTPYLFGVGVFQLKYIEITENREVKIVLFLKLPFLLQRPP